LLPVCDPRAGKITADDIDSMVVAGAERRL